MQFLQPASALPASRFNLQLPELKPARLQRTNTGICRVVLTSRLRYEAQLIQIVTGELFSADRIRGKCSREISGGLSFAIRVPREQAGTLWLSAALT
jgi:hypothetical protein